MELVPFELANEYEVPRRGNGIGRFEIGDTLLVWCGTEQVPFYLDTLPQFDLVPLGARPVDVWTWMQRAIAQLRRCFE